MTLAPALQTVASCPPAQLQAHLAKGELVIDYGAARVRLQAPPSLAHFHEAFRTMYGAFALQTIATRPFSDFHVAMQAGRGWRRWLRPQARFLIDQICPFEPFSLDNALPHYEWGLNWSFGQRSNQYVLLHAGVVSAHGRGVIMAAPPGSGKSTLTAALMLSGFRLLSDEFGVVCPHSGELLAMLKPVALKNNAIQVIGDFAAHAQLGPCFVGTRKGDVAHLAPDAPSVATVHERVTPAVLVFPQFRAGAALKLEPVEAHDAFGRLAFNSFNYHLLGPLGFQTVTQLAASCPAYCLEYGDLPSGVAAIHDVLDKASPSSSGRQISVGAPQ